MGVFDPISEGVGRGMQLWLEGKRGKEDKRRYDIEQKALKELRDLQKRQTEQSMTLEQEEAERERRLWSPGREEKMGFTGALPYTVKGEEPGINIQRLQTQLATEKKQLGGYETPEQTRLSQQDWERRMANLRHQHALELAGFKQGEVEEAPFDETGTSLAQVNPQRSQR